MSPAVTGVRRITLALTGASGVQYGLRLLECLLAQGCQVDLMISKAAHLVIETETDEQLPANAARLTEVLNQRYAALPGKVQAYGREDWFAPAASGSGAASSMVICPCSGGTLSALATGASNNLIERAGDVALKERRQLLLVMREMPLHQVHLEQMLKLTQMGAVVMPASPGFYHRPESVEAMVDFVVARILDQLGLEQQLMPRWGEP
ncbi:flavin prenyltransferase UbiX [Marinospirillum alkaliphilum]|uniref:Flavin prenyltransferase UbiX n=1 Tax=Marinospirillum alkaliphilum DSM 21637 TaxID=1122209 RepID=A0A1K1YMP3_9GAMM|nr:flavin prenyltransferase UbiX [Marinospirillum alkaliphilum]SFX62699.1 4-hydroxy-3-polyprenylbenzoate decarboxylase [Marinospirillum alkaliphilum DSM 21637]